jgi:uncharacterized protein with ParB-like and HNH nuclease domain
MNGSARSLEWIIEKRFEVPFFQRPYVWNENNWEELWNAIFEAKKDEMPFIGSFILQQEQGKPNGTYLVIDGQQRLTTLSMLIKAYLDFAKDITESDPSIGSSFDLLKNRIMESKTTGMHTTFKPRVEPSVLDRDDFLKIMDFDQKINLDSINEKSSNMMQCYKFFALRIGELSKERKIELGTKFLTQSLFYIAIELDPNDDEQKIFDSVNRLGMELRSSDIIKNNLFQRVKELAGQGPEVLELYNENWHKVFYESGEVRGYWESKIVLGRLTMIALDAFLKDFATIKGIYVPSESGGIDDLSKAYKDYASSLSLPALIDFIKEIGSYGRDYYALFQPKALEVNVEMSDALKTTLLILKACDTTTFNPYLLYLQHQKPANLDELLKNLQKFFLRRYIYGQSVKNYNKICLQLLKKETNPFEYLATYSNKDEDLSVIYSAFPPLLLRVPNDKFGKLIIFLTELIRRKTDGTQNFSTLIAYNKFSLEHIMPQKWQTNWSNIPCYDRDGVLIEETGKLNVIRGTEIWSIGNMMLLTKNLNSKIGNSEFAIKVNGNGTKRGRGIKDFVGGCATSQEILDVFNTKGEWNESSIYSRELEVLKTLNNEYGFFGDVDSLSIPAINFGPEEEKKFDVMDPTTYGNVTCGKLAYGFFSYLLGNGKLSEKEIVELSDADFTKNHFPTVFLSGLINQPRI